MKNLLVRQMADDVVDAGIVVIGTGIAGLAAALSLAPRPVTVVTKTRLGQGGSSPWAQGGIGRGPWLPEIPLPCTPRTPWTAGAGLCDPEAVALLTEEGPRRVRQLIEIGARFDRDARGDLVMGREGAHGRRRILHAGGDQTGAEMVRALVSRVRAEAAIQVRENTFAMDLVRRDDRVVGVLCRHAGGGFSIGRPP